MFHCFPQKQIRFSLSSNINRSEQQDGDLDFENIEQKLFYALTANYQSQPKTNIHTTAAEN